jgi:large conductance mechanosensitive channel
MTDRFPRRLRPNRGWLRAATSIGANRSGGETVLREFREFIARGNLVDLAVAFILGVAFAGVVSAFTNIILSLIGAIFGASLTFDRLKASVNGTPIPYGALITALVNFLVVAFALFLVVKAYNRFRDRPDATTRACPDCTLQIPKSAKRCPECTSQVTPVVA